MKVRELTEWGRVVQDVNTTSDVDCDEIQRQAEKFGNKVDIDGRPPTINSSETDMSVTNIYWNLGLTGNR